VRLHIGEESTTLAQESSNRRVELATGWNDIVRRFFRHDPPTPFELEAAIEAVEDEIMRVRHDVPSAPFLETADSIVLQVALAAGVPPGEEMILALEAVEQSFQRLAGGAPGSSQSPRSSSTLLVLRELMHHFAFREVRVTRAPA
jgi:hypothetical protein